MVIGDVHGDAERLRRALSTVVEKRALTVLVGDYVNRGPDSSGVLDLLWTVKRDYGDRICLLRGNHDQSLLDFLVDRDLGRFAALGGLATIRSYCNPPRASVVKDFVDGFPARHREILESTVPYWESLDTLVSHAGVNPDEPHERDPQHMVLGNYPQLFERPLVDQFVICGHYIQRNGLPYASRSLICLDTGCGSIQDAPLTAVVLPEREFYRF